MLIKSLEASGFVSVTQGKGTFVSSSLPDVLKQQMRLAIRLRRWSLLALLEARRALEAEAARCAAERATPEDIEAIEKTHAEIIAGTHDSARFIHLGMDFHLEVARASHSETLCDLLEGLRVATQEALSRVPRSRLQFEESWQQHRALLDAIKARDSELAMRLAALHIDSLKSLASEDNSRGGGR